MKQLSSNRCFNGEQRIYEHESSIVGLPMKFGVYLPPQALKSESRGEKCKTLFYLAGLTCTEETFAIKAHAQQLASELGFILVSPDTSPRGDVAQGDHWDIGEGAGFYIDAVQEPWAPHYKMESYITQELYQLVQDHFPVEAGKVGIFGHSMGGHGALTLAFKYPELYSSVSAFAPIAAPVDCAWGQKAFRHYLGNNEEEWQAHDASRLIAKKGKQFQNILVDQGTADQFLEQLCIDQLETACQESGQPITLRFHTGYDHGYYFIQSFMQDHLNFHAEQLQ
ncbi:S-formylglutathione hydrolase [Alkanindiges sp. WGS2144]|uniref:S-formylglutathione hydrolase n=1 Tax=Alkanindiges sp. WGS2144 TaxID=3366808 RepID=UPI003753E7AC